MAFHFEKCGKLKTRMQADDFNPKESSDKMLALTTAVHMADISNTAKPWDINQKWIELLFDEFFT